MSEGISCAASRKERIKKREKLKIRIEGRRQKEEIKGASKGQKFYRRYVGASYNEEGNNIKIQDSPVLKRTFSLSVPQ